MSHHATGAVKFLFFFAQYSTLRPIVTQSSSHVRFLCDHLISALFRHCALLGRKNKSGTLGFNAAHQKRCKKVEATAASTPPASRPRRKRGQRFNHIQYWLTLSGDHFLWAGVTLEMTRRHISSVDISAAEIDVLFYPAVKRNPSEAANPPPTLNPPPPPPPPPSSSSLNYQDHAETSVKHFQRPPLEKQLRPLCGGGEIAVCTAATGLFNQWKYGATFFFCALVANPFISTQEVC